MGKDFRNNGRTQKSSMQQKSRILNCKEEKNKSKAENEKRNL